jgi:hypothetical protein
MSAPPAGSSRRHSYGHHYAAELREVDQEPRQLFWVPTVLATYDLLVEYEYEYAPADLDISRGASTRDLRVSSWDIAMGRTMLMG